MHINELLCYAAYYMNNSNLNNIKTIIRSFYSTDDLSNAKKLLWDLCHEFLDPFIERRNTENRSSRDANISDIFDALRKLDGLEKIPVFVARDMSMVPDRQPEKLNMVSIINRLSTLEKNMADFDNVVLKHESELQNMKNINLLLDSKLKKLEPSKENYEKYKLFFSSGDSNAQGDHEVAAEDASSTDWESLDEGSRPQSLQKNRRKGNKPSKQSKAKDLTSNYTRRNLKSVSSTSDLEDFHGFLASSDIPVPSSFAARAVDNEGFQLQESRKQKRRRYEHMNQLQGAPPPTLLLF